jgi:hypothetical protein
MKQLLREGVAQRFGEPACLVPPTQKMEVYYEQ